MCDFLTSNAAIFGSASVAFRTQGRVTSPAAKQDDPIDKSEMAAAKMVFIISAL